MYVLSYVVKDAIPNYLAGLPIPNSISGWFRLGVREWLTLIPPTAVVGCISYYSYKTYKKAQGGGQMNPDYRKDIRKVVDFVDIEDIGEKAAFCRCWRSKNMPYCDGAHGKYNRETGDNVGPIVVRRQDLETK